MQKAGIRHVSKGKELRQLVNQHMAKKYNEIFYFYQVKPINEIIFNQKSAKTNLCFKQAIMYNNQLEFIKRYYNEGNSQGNKQIEERIQLLTDYYWDINKMTYTYPTLILNNVKKIFDQRFLRKIKKTAADDTQNQIIRRKNYKIYQQNTPNFNLFDDYDNVSISNKSYFLQKSQQVQIIKPIETQEYDIHNLYQQSSSINLPPPSFHFDQIEEENSMNHLICDFGDLDEDKVIQQYQMIQLKRRKKNEIKINNKHNKLISQKNNPETFIIVQNPSKNIQKKKEKGYSKLEDNLSKDELGINITGTRDTKQYSGEFIRFNNQWSHQKNYTQNYLFQSKAQTVLSSNNLSKNKKYNSKSNKQKKYKLKQYCLNLNTKQIYEKDCRNYGIKTQLINHHQNHKKNIFGTFSQYNKNSTSQIHEYSTPSLKSSKLKNKTIRPSQEAISKLFTFRKQQNHSKNNLINSEHFINPFMEQLPIKNYQITRQEIPLFQSKHSFGRYSSLTPQEQDYNFNKQIQNQQSLRLSQQDTKNEYEKGNINQINEQNIELQNLKEKIKRLKQIQLHYQANGN